MDILRRVPQWARLDSGQGVAVGPFYPPSVPPAASEWPLQSGYGPSLGAGSSGLSRSNGFNAISPLDIIIRDDQLVCYIHETGF